MALGYIIKMWKAEILKVVMLWVKKCLFEYGEQQVRKCKLVASGFAFQARYSLDIIMIERNAV